MKIVLVGINAKYAHTNLAIRHLKNYCADDRVEIAEYTINMPREKILADLEKKEADAYGFSVYIWNVGLVYPLADKLSGRVIFFGGPEASYDIGEALRHGSYVIRGEGEEAFARFATDFFAGRDVAETPSLCYWKEGLLHNNPLAKKADLDALAQPYFDLPMLKNRILYYESSRGCPFSCAYCLSSAEQGVRFASAEKVKRDIEAYAAAGAMNVKFVDRTFNADRKRAAEIVRHIALQGKDSEFHFELAADLIDGELIEALRTGKKGKVQLEIGVQSTHMPTLKAVGRVQDFSYTSEVVRALAKDKNVILHLDLIAGLPLEGIKEFQKSLDDVMALGADAVQLGFLKILKGSGMERLAEKYGIEASASAPYEVVRTGHISSEELQHLKKIAYLLDRLYNSGLFQISTRIISGLVGGFYAFFDRLVKFAEEQGRDLGRMGERELARLLLDYGRGRQAWELFRDAVRADCLIKPRRPIPEECLLKKEDWQRAFYRNLPLPYAKNMPRGKRPWHYSRAESFSFDLPRYLREGILQKRATKVFFDYVEGSVREILL